DSDFTLTVTATSTEGAAEAPGSELQDADNTASTSFTIDVTVDDVPPADDGPTAVDDGPVQIVEPADTHAVFVIDTSASLTQQELAIMEDALKHLATTLFERNPDGTVITLIEFDNDANFMGGGNGTFYTLQEVLDALENLDSLSDGSTNYFSALGTTQTVDFEPGYDQAIYFISDGQPTQGNTQGGIDEFNNWVTNDLNDAKVYAVGIGSDAENSIHLGQIDNTPEDNNHDPDPGDPYLHVESPEELIANLLPSDAAVSGNVLTNDIPGSDPFADVPITAISYKGAIYDLSDGGEPNVTVNGNTLTLDADFGILEIDFATGGYSYVANTDIADFEAEEFNYTIIDDDGSTSSAVLRITITPESTYTGTDASENIIGGSGNDYILGAGGDDTLFGGDGDDRFVYQNANTDGNDVIEDFGANGDNDVIDLTALFDELGIAPADRADHVVFAEEGGNTTITVTDGTDVLVPGFSIVVENASLDNSDITNGKIVVDES
ncbi:VWA domain-containing protein, partial [Sneathiella chungangensis]|uniref:VWA domain-containing protein n=1 Tax=Sneathiella chungangensis TaxID=1418234 RepID=UPI003619318A